MTTQDKADLYDAYIHENDRLQRIVSRIKSEYAGNIPPDKQKEINETEARIAVIIGKVEKLVG